jgi:hypothetical protein
MEILFIVIFAYLRRLRQEKLAKAATIAAQKASVAVDKAKAVAPLVTKS